MNPPIAGPLLKKMLKIDQWTIPQVAPELPGRSEIHLWKIELSTPGLDLAYLLSPDEQMRHKRLLHKADRIRFGNARGGLRSILSRYCHIPPARVPIDYSENGKPRLKFTESGLQFNLSHAGELALLAVSRETPVGIDLEFMSMRKNLRRIARKMFDQQLFQQLESLDEELFKKAFFINWTAMEARVKAAGGGVFSHSRECSPLPCINFQPHPGWCAALATVGKLPAVENWTLLKFSPDPTVQIG